SYHHGCREPLFRVAEQGLSSVRERARATNPLHRAGIDPKPLRDLAHASTSTEIDMRPVNMTGKRPLNTVSYQAIATARAGACALHRTAARRARCTVACRSGFGSTDIARGVATPQGGKWHAAQVIRVRERLA